MPLFRWVFWIVILFAVLTVVYLTLSLYNRWAERRRLVADFESRTATEGTSPDNLDSYVDQGMNDYERSLRKKLLLGVYLIPLAVTALLVGVAIYG